MFARKNYKTESFSNRAGKATSKSKRSFRDHAVAAKRTETVKPKKPESPPVGR